MPEVRRSIENILYNGDEGFEQACYRHGPGSFTEQAVIVLFLPRMCRLSPSVEGSLPGGPRN